MAKSNQTKLWLENYNDSNAFASPDMVGDGFSNVGRNSSPAWGGQFEEGGIIPIAQKGKKVIAESTGVYKKPFNERELKNIIKDDVEYRRTGDIKNPRAEANKFEKYLPSKETADFFKKLKKDVGPAAFKEALKIQHERGNPAVNVGTNKGLPFHNRRNYNPFTNEINIPKPLDDTSDLENYLTEVSHAGQPLSEVIPRFLKNDIPGYIKAYTTEGDSGDNIQQYVYDNPSTVENYTHAKIQPELQQRIDSAYSWPKSKEEEAEFIEYTKQSIDNPHYQMGGSISGAVGFTYARTKGIPSEGPYAKKTMPSAQNGKEMQYYQNGLDFQPKTISKNGAWLDNYNEGGIIKDDRGQWDHPGEITEIGSNEITMEGVPYDVLGISDTGDTKLMKPGKDYKFKGKKVTEFPMAKNGLRQEQKGLVNLDDLTNFTNYNKPTKGWLNKYN